MGETEVRVFRPYKIVAVVMSLISVILMIISVAGPDWMKVSYHEGNVKSWGLWWDCIQVTGSFQMCVQPDWLSACAALVLIGLICMVLACVLGIIGIIKHKRLLYVICGSVCVFAVLVQIICLIIYPVKFTEDVREVQVNRTETQRFDLDWTYGVAWGAVCFMIGAAIMFFIRKETQEVTTVKDNTPPPYYLNYTRA